MIAALLEIIGGLALVLGSAILFLALDHFEQPRGERLWRRRQRRRDE